MATVSLLSLVSELDARLVDDVRLFGDDFSSAKSDFMLCDVEVLCFRKGGLFRSVPFSILLDSE